MITTDRNQFLGVHVTRATKHRLQEEAKKRGKSVSALVSEILEREVKRQASAPKEDGQ